MIQASLKTVRVRASQAIKSNMNIFGNCRESMQIDGSDFRGGFNPMEMYAKIIEYSFLGVVAAWEEFVGESFIRYLVGAKSCSGYTPALIVPPCKTLADAREMVKGLAGVNNYKHVGWHSYDRMVKHADRAFAPGHPYRIGGPDIAERLRDAIIIRDRVAHHSDEARAGFKRVVNKIRGQPAGESLPYGMGPGHLLCWNADEAFPNGRRASHTEAFYGDIYEAYCLTYLELINRIAPPAPGEPRFDIFWK